MEALRRVRAAWARADFAPARAALGRAVELGPWARTRPAAGARLGAGDGLALTGRLSVEPMGGAVFEGGRRLDPGWPPAAPVDWLVRAFPSRRRFEAVAPVWHGRHADAVALFAELLPRLAMLERLGVGPEVVALISREMGRLKPVQALLAAGALAPRPVKVQGWDQVIEARRAVLLRPDATDAGDAARAGARLRAVFGATPGGAVWICRSEEAAGAPPGSDALALDAAGLARVVRRAAGAEALAASRGAAAALETLEGARRST